MEFTLLISDEKTFLFKSSHEIGKGSSTIDVTVLGGRGGRGERGVSDP
jgi:hypothetical protein